jgi:hypothetical protein
LGLAHIVHAAEKDIDKQGDVLEHSGRNEVQKHGEQPEQTDGEQPEQKVDSTDNGG